MKPTKYQKRKLLVQAMAEFDRNAGNIKYDPLLLCSCAETAAYVRLWTRKMAVARKMTAWFSESIYYLFFPLPRPSEDDIIWSVRTDTSLDLPTHTTEEYNDMRIIALGLMLAMVQEGDI